MRGIGERRRATQEHAGYGATERATGCTPRGDTFEDKREAPEAPEDTAGERGDAAAKG